MSSVGWVWLSINREIRFIVGIYNNMKNYSKISVFLFIICVFGDYGGRAERVTVMEGDSLTLDIDLREKFNHIMWTFGDSYSIIAETDGYEASYGKDERFRDRLKMNNQTGSLTIKNMRVTDSGVYHLEINHNSVISYKRFIITVHVFGADEDGVKRESVMEGDSVTLDIDLTERFNRIEWRFGDSGSVIAESDGNKISYGDDERFRDRLKMNNQTGSLTINNMAIANSGVYKLRFDHNTGTSSATFIVIVCDPALSPGEVTAIVVVVLLVLAAAAVLYYHHKISKRRRQNVFGDYEDGVKRVSVMEGDSVTLDTRLREKFNHIMWMFGDSGSVIAEIDGNKIPYTDDERFRDRLKMNNQTGSLTIKNMRDTDSGVYHLEINGTSNKTFNVTVHVFGDYEDGVKRESVMEGDSVTLDTDLTEFNHINWLFGDSYSFISKSDGDEISYPLNDTERFRDRLKMNNQTGSLTINNMRITDSGVYEIEMHHDTWEPYEKIEIVVCGSSVSVPALSPGDVTAIGVVVLLVLSAAAAVLYYHHKISKRRRQNREYYS